MTDNGSVVAAVGVGRDYVLAAHTVHALVDVDLSVEPGSLVAVRGRSGSGKTTLLNLLGGLDRPTSGKVYVGGSDITNLGEDQLALLRRDKIGFIFQAFGLIPILSAAENVEVPMRLAGATVSARQQRARELLSQVGLGERAAHRPHELSGGEQQRVAIARALANEPEILIADEPTGQLDSRTGLSIVELIHGLVRNRRIAAVIATHDPSPIAVADRVFDLSDGRLTPAGG